MTSAPTAPLGWNGGSPSLVVIGRFASLGFSLISVPIVARAIGPEGRGVTASMLAVLLTMTVATGLGVPLALRRRVAEGADLRLVVSAGRTFAVATVVPSVAMGFLVNALLYASEPIENQVSFVISAALIPFSISWAQDVSVLVAQRKFLKLSILGLLQSAATLAILLALWAIGHMTVATVVYANLAGNIVTFLVGVAWLRAGIGNINYARSVTREGLSLVGAQLADTATKKVDQIIALPLLGAHGAGLYSVAATVASLSAPVAQAIAAGMFTGMVGHEGRRPEIAARTVRYSLAIGFPTAISLAAAAAVGVPIVFGVEFTEAVLPAAILAAAAPSQITNYVCANWLAAQQRGRELTLIQIVSLVVTAALLVIGGWLWSVTGAATAAAVAATIAAAMMAVRVSPRLTSWIPRLSDIGSAFNLLIKGT